jgi:hypothetical protein
LSLNSESFTLPLDFETRSLPSLTHSHPRRFTFYACRAVAVGVGGSQDTSANHSIGERIDMKSIDSSEPKAHTANVRGEFRELIHHLRQDVEKIEDPKAQALFEAAAEVLTGLDTAFKHFEEKSEEAWK